MLNGQQRDIVAAVMHADARVRVVLAAGETIPARLGMRLSTGDEVVVPPGSRVDLLYRDGRLERLSTGTRLGARPARPAALPGLAAGTVRGDTSRVRPLAGYPVPISPRNGATVLALRPAFTWHQAATGAHYELRWRRAGDSVFTRLAVGTDTTVILPAAAGPLVPGELYEWTVVPVPDGRIAPPATFRIVPAAVVEQLVALDAAIRASGLEDGARRQMEIVALDVMGLPYEALAALTRYRRETGAELPEPLQELESLLLAATGRDAAARSR